MPDPAVTTSETELRPIVERALSASYELDREIGRGGMGIVYRAKDRRLKRPVAIKLLPPELAFRSEIRTRFLREAETAAQLNHPHIVPIYSVDEHDGLVYFVMAIVDGDNLGKRIHDRGPLPIDDTRRILAEVADALAYAHSRGVVHRDIKPDNILLDAADGHALVTDFGIARAIIEGSDSRLTATGMAIGTPAYMSPEQSAGDREIDGRSDLYSLGVVAYQMLAGELPFQASSTPAMLVKHLSERPLPIEQRRPDVPPDLSAIVMRLLEKDPANRFSGAEELEGMLRGTIAPPPPTYSVRSAEPNRQGVTSDLGFPGYAAGPSAPTRPLGGAQAGMPPAAAGYPMRAESSAFGMDVAVGGQDPRWDAKPVVAFRKKLGTYVIVNAAILILSLVTNVELTWITAFWTIFMAFKYAQLWSDNYDWRDVLKQPRDRLFVDVVAEQADSVGALFDKEKRANLREKVRRERVTREWQQPAASLPPTEPLPSPARPRLPVDGAYGSHHEIVRGAMADRDEIARLLATMPKGDRDRIPDVLPSAEKLALKVQALAATVAELDRNNSVGAVEPLEREITRLEAEANPLDRVASEERVKRLAYLKRQRRALRDMSRRRDEAASNLEQCRLLLQNMRLDLVRLRTGAGGSYVQMTTVADRAMALAREVDAVVQAADEVRRI
ncbi:protein kinase [Gemmatirosa kalamazoonensis]|uniref:non-specific serine/threonine protein kinase n=1 Tax=Gemmatirosa kalamazoonensis TaxID=861299 RepID=W0RMI6_9BACT|nr:serine/threonine-protein kinase [Gemmatirosa kalamazoonensis]AHG91986.1 protein kinase [Gemmatirosa kalamazoonensis]